MPFYINKLILYSFILLSLSSTLLLYILLAYIFATGGPSMAQVDILCICVATVGYEWQNIASGPPLSHCWSTDSIFKILFKAL